MRQPATQQTGTGKGRQLVCAPATGNELAAATHGLACLWGDIRGELGGVELGKARQHGS